MALAPTPTLTPTLTRCAPIKPTAAERTLAARQASWDGAAATLREAASAIVVGGGLVGAELQP